MERTTQTIALIIRSSCEARILLHIHGSLVFLHNLAWATNPWRFQQALGVLIPERDEAFRRRLFSNAGLGATPAIQPSVGRIRLGPPTVPTGGAT